MSTEKLSAGKKYSFLKTNFASKYQTKKPNFFRAFNNQFLFVSVEETMKSKSIELLAFDENQELQYEGKCKLCLNRISEMLFVKPKKEEHKMITAQFKWNFVMDKNILFAFAENEFDDFALIFNDEIRCKKVYKFICKETAQNNADKELLKKRFFICICEKIARKNDEKICEIARKWIDSHHRKEQQEYFNILNENNVYELVYSTRKGKQISNAKTSFTSVSKDYLNKDITQNVKRSCILRKRRFAEMSGKDTQKEEQVNSVVSDTTQIPNKTSKIFPITVNHSQYDIVNVKRDGSRTMQRLLLIFTSNEKNQCYEYFWNPKRNIFKCIGCKAKRKQLTAVISRDEKGFKCIKVEDKKHLCIPIPYAADKYIKMKILKKPGYELLENCNTFSGKLLLIFNEKDKSQCWEFRQIKDSDIYKCRQCKTFAKLWNSNAEDEYVELRNVEHCCQVVPYDLDKYYQFHDFVLSPQFEIKTTIKKNGEEKKKLIVFDKNDRSLCYSYSFFEKNFRCDGCQYKKYRVAAKLLKNSDGEGYVLLSKRKHICKLLSYSEVTKKKVILHPPDFEVIEKTTNDVQKLVIFDSMDRNLCYIFTQRKEGHANWYSCLNCLNIQGYRGCNPALLSRKKNSNGAEIAHAHLLKNENNNEYFVEFNDGKHICKPQKYEPEKYAKKEIPKCYDYFFYRPKHLPNCVNVAFYHPKDKKVCFPFNYQRTTDNFRCGECKNHKYSFILKIKEDGNGKEYFNHDFQKHVCKPTKVSLLRGSEYVALKRNEFTLETKKKPEIIDESRIIKFPGFELRQNRDCVPDASLFVFKPDDRSIGYRYRHSSFFNHYVCCKLPHCGVNAKLEVDENGENFVILSKSNHKCDPIKYEKPVETFKTEPKLFELHPNAKSDPDKRLIIFTSAEKDFIHEFSKTSKKSFHCLPCRAKKNNIMVKLLEDKNGQKRIEFVGKQDHICEPRKYDPSKYAQPKIIPIEQFVFHDGKNSEKDKYLVIFVSEKKDLAYQYYMEKAGFYVCNGCSNKKKWISASVVVDKENDNKSVKLCQQEHVCEPRKYDPTKYVYSEPKIISSDQFAFHNGSNGEKEKYLVVFTSEKKDFVYQYYSNRPGYFSCKSCSTRRHHVYATIIENENGAKSVKLCQQEHVCEPRKYDPKKYVYSESKIVSNEYFTFCSGIGTDEKEKYLILFTSAEKDYFYKYYMVKPNTYICHECNNKKKHYVSAKVIEDENGLKFLKLSSGKEHVCQPKKYNPEKFDRQRIISSDGFVLHPNTKGEKNKHLKVFTSEKKDFVYQYFMAKPSKPGYYVCSGCDSKKLCVSASIIEGSDGTKSLKINEKEHVCKPRKYDPRKC